jgi:hypothetical protein
MVKGTILFLRSIDLNKVDKNSANIEQTMDLTGQNLKEYQAADFVIYGDKLVLKNKYGKTGVIGRKK